MEVTFEIQIGTTNRRNGVQSNYSIRVDFPRLGRHDRVICRSETLDWLLHAMDLRARKVVCIEWKRKRRLATGARLYLLRLQCTYIWVISRYKIEACLYGASACIIDVNHDATRRDSPIRCMQIMNDITDWLINKHDTERTCRANQFFFSFFPFLALLVSTSEVVPIRSDLVRSGIRKRVLRGTFSRF